MVSIFEPFEHHTVKDKFFQHVLIGCSSREEIYGVIEITIFFNFLLYCLDTLLQPVKQVFIRLLVKTFIRLVNERRLDVSNVIECHTVEGVNHVGEVLKFPGIGKSHDVTDELLVIILMPHILVFLFKSLLLESFIGIMSHHITPALLELRVLNDFVQSIRQPLSFLTIFTTFAESTSNATSQTPMRYGAKRTSEKANCKFLPGLTLPGNLGC